MKNITNALLPLASLAMFADCIISLFGLLVVVKTSIGLAGELPMAYYQRLNIGVVSVLAPTVGIILFFFIGILIGLRRKPAETVETIPIEGGIDTPMNAPERIDETLAHVT